MPLEALQYEENGSQAIFRLLDQRELPLRSVYTEISGPEAAWTAIKVLQALQISSSSIAFSKIPTSTKRTLEDGNGLWLQDMAVRGAPAIAIAGALALAVELQNQGAGKQFLSAQEAEKQIKAKLAYLVTR